MEQRSFRSDQPEIGKKQSNYSLKSRQRLSFLSSSSELWESFNDRCDEGKQVKQYFNFLNFVLANNLLMAVWSLVAWLPHASNVLGRMEKEGVGSTYGLGRSGVADVLFLSSFQPSSDRYLELMIVLATLTMFLTAPAYYLVAKRYFDDEQHEPDPGGAVHEDDRTPHFDPAYPSGGLPGRRRRLVASYLVFIIVCGVPAGVDYGLAFDLTHRKLKPMYERYAGLYPPAIALPSTDADVLTDSPLAITLIVVAVKAVFDLIFESVAVVLNDLERHATYSSYRFHRLLKLLVFRMCNTQSLFIVRHFADVPFYPCLAARTGNQVFCIRAIRCLCIRAIKCSVYGQSGVLYTGNQVIFKLKE